MHIAKRRSAGFASAPRLALLSAALAAVALFATSGAAAAAEAGWTTYHHDAERSGVDPDGVSPVTPVLAWQSVDLGAPIWGQPLVVGSRVYVATVSDQVYALEATTGAIAWQASAGTPVPAGALPCGDIKPTVGIVGTPVIDPADGVLYAVADTWNGSHAEHLLEGFRVSNGERVLSTPADPPGSDPQALLQRTALNLDAGNVVFGYGGNDGDCSDYKGAVASVPEHGAAASFWQVPIAAPSSSGGAVWATGGPAVDAAGNIYASTGNPDPPSGQEASTYDYSDSVVELNPSLALTGYFEPPSWKADSNSDRDLSSGAPELLPGGLIFQAGKNGTGYLLDEANLGSGAPAVYSHQVCNGQGSFGGDSYANGVIYVPCTNGVQALSYDAAARTFTPMWQGPADAFGPPIVSAGLVWAVATGGFNGGGTKLYGLEPSTGALRYTEQLPSPIADHFASPSAGGGRLLVATGSTVSAYQVAMLTSFPGAGTPVPSPAPTAAPRTIASPLLLLRVVSLHLHASAKGLVHLLISCPAQDSCSGTLALHATLRLAVGYGRQRHIEPVHVPLVHTSFATHRGDFTVTLHLDRRARALLRHYFGLLHVTVTIAVPGIGTRKMDALLRAPA